jgi:hypothetical protein
LIHIERERINPKTGKEIAPQESWFKRAEDATKNQASDSKKFREDIWQDHQVSEALRELFHGKCAYCESKTENCEVEHYRPKASVDESPEHPG